MKYLSFSYYVLLFSEIIWIITLYIHQTSWLFFKGKQPFSKYFLKILLTNFPGFLQGTCSNSMVYPVLELLFVFKFQCFPIWYEPWNWIICLKYVLCIITAFPFVLIPIFQNIYKFSPDIIVVVNLIQIVIILLWAHIGHAYVVLFHGATLKNCKISGVPSN